MTETEPLNPELFALLVQRMLASVSPYRWLLHAESFTLFTDVGFALPLANLYELYVTTESPENLSELQKQLQEFLTPGDRNSGSEVLSALFPYLRSHISLVRDNDRLATNSSPDLGDELVLLPYADVLGVGLVIENGGTPFQVRYSDLDRLGLSVEVAIEIAVENLMRKSVEPFRVVQAGFYVSSWRDSYDGARLLLPDLFANLQVDGEIVAMAPTPDTVLVTGSKDVEGISLLTSLGGNLVKDRYGVFALPMVLRNGVWESFEVPESDPVFNTVNSFRLSVYNLTYCDQERFLVQKRVDRQGMFACPFLTERDKWNGYQFSKTNIVDGRINSFPECDIVEFYRFNTEGTRDCVARAPFTTVVEQLGNSLSEDRTFLPVRWRLKDFPKRSELAALGMMVAGRGLLNPRQKTETERVNEPLEGKVSMPIPAGARLMPRVEEVNVKVKEKDTVLEFFVDETSDSLKDFYLQRLNVRSVIQVPTEQGNYLVVEALGAAWSREAWLRLNPVEDEATLKLIIRTNFKSLEIRNAFKKQGELLQPFEQVFGISLLVDMKPVGALVISKDNASQGFTSSDPPEKVLKFFRIQLGVQRTTYTVADQDRPHLLINMDAGLVVAVNPEKARGGTQCSITKLLEGAV